MNFFSRLEKRLYSFMADYFRFFANFSLKRWQPRVIAITGSVGKTTMLNLVEFELGKKAHYSHDANSPFGVPFDVLGLKGIKSCRLLWIYLVLAAPIRGLFYTHKEKFYVVEIDGDRPDGARKLAEWLKPELTIWVSLGRSHVCHFDDAVKAGKFETVEDAITSEFASLAKNTQKIVYIDADEPMMVEATKNLDVKVVEFKKSDMKKYLIYPNSTDFSAGATTFHFNQPEPRELSIQLLMLKSLCEYLKIDLKTDFSNLKIAPGRSTFLKGKNGLEIIDSSYNAHLSSMKSILNMAKSLHASHKWLIIGDIVEAGSIEAEEHRSLADLIAEVEAEEVILVGPRTKKYTAPRLKELGISPKTTLDPKKALEYIEKNSHGRETLIFKGSQYLEWIIEKLLENPEDAKLLPRRDPAARKRRAKRGLN
ncbi:hypothetical protein IJF86_02515 [Candidatus Saccharibacteria bacterium]|nr:hypothetical protein [Candidatus Saccharibacteria bacterium]